MIEDTYFDKIQVAQMFGEDLPCATCGKTLKRHAWLTRPELVQYKTEGFDINLCRTDHDTYFLLCHLVSSPKPEDPCDSEYVEEIST